MCWLDLQTLLNGKKGFKNVTYRNINRVEAFNSLSI